MSDSEFSIQRELDAICNEFEDNWSGNGRASNYNAFLNRIDEMHRDRLLRMLVEVDIELRKKADESVSAGDYAELGDSVVAHVAQILINDSDVTVPPNRDPAQNLATTAPQTSPSSSQNWIGPYKLLQQIGEGGMGSVYMAEQEKPVRRRVALKLIRADMGSKETIARFEAERQALAMMDHQNIAKVLDAGTTEDGNPFFVMELVKGIPLTQFCDDNKLNVQERLELFVPVCKAIQHAHQKGIVHRDLKPSNVLVTLYDGEAVPKVIDFGLAKALEHTTKLTDKTMFTEFGKVVGTLQYMSPEQAEMNALDVDTRTDIYSLGVMLYELLTGSTPLDKETLGRNALLQVLQIIREKEPPRPSHRLSSSGDAATGISAQRKIAPSKLQQILRGELDWVVMKALEKDRRRRYETANDFAQDIQRYLEGETVTARPASAIYRVSKFVKKHRGLVASATTIAALLIVGIIGTSTGWMQASTSATRELAARKKAENQEKIATEALENAKRETARAQSQSRRANALRLLTESSAITEELPNRSLLLTIAAAEATLDSGEPILPEVKSEMYSLLMNIDGEPFQQMPSPEEMWFDDHDWRRRSIPKRHMTWVDSAGKKYLYFRTENEQIRRFQLPGVGTNIEGCAALVKRNLFFALATDGKLMVWDYVKNGDQLPIKEISLHRDEAQWFKRPYPNEKWDFSFDPTSTWLIVKNSPRFGRLVNLDRLALVEFRSESVAEFATWRPIDIVFRPSRNQVMVLSEHKNNYAKMIQKFSLDNYNLTTSALEKPLFESSQLPYNLRIAQSGEYVSWEQEYINETTSQRWVYNMLAADFLEDFSKPLALSRHWKFRQDERNDGELLALLRNDQIGIFRFENNTTSIKLEELHAEDLAAIEEWRSSKRWHSYPSEAIVYPVIHNSPNWRFIEDRFGGLIAIDLRDASANPIVLDVMPFKRNETSKFGLWVSPNSKWLLTLDRSKKIELFNIESPSKPFRSVLELKDGIENPNLSSKLRIAFSSDDRFLAIASDALGLKVFDLSNEAKELGVDSKNIDDSITDITFAPDASWLMCLVKGESDCSVAICDLDSDKKVLFEDVFWSHGNSNREQFRLRDIHFSPSCQWMCLFRTEIGGSGSIESSIEFVNLGESETDGNQLRSKERDLSCTYPNIKFSPDENKIALFENRKLEYVNLKDGSVIVFKVLLDGIIHNVAFDNESTLIGAKDATGQAIGFQLKDSGTSLQIKTSSTETFKIDPKLRFAAGIHEGSLELRNFSRDGVQSSEPTRLDLDHPITEFEFAPDGNWLVAQGERSSNSPDSQLAVCSLNNTNHQLDLLEHRLPKNISRTLLYREFQFSPSNRWLASSWHGEFASHIKLFQLQRKNGVPLDKLTISEKTDPYVRPRFSSNDSWLILPSNKGNLTFVDLRDSATFGRKRKPQFEPPIEARKQAFLPDSVCDVIAGNTAILCHFNKYLDLIDLDAEDPHSSVRTFSFENDISEIKLSPDEKWLCILEGGSCWLVDLESEGYQNVNRVIHDATQRKENDPPTAYFSSNSTYLITAVKRAATARLADTPDGQFWEQASDHSSSSIKVWRLGNQKPFLMHESNAVIYGDPSSNNAVAGYGFDNNNEFLVINSAEGDLRLFDLTGDEIKEPIWFKPPEELPEGFVEIVSSANDRWLALVVPNKVFVYDKHVSQELPVNPRTLDLPNTIEVEFLNGGEFLTTCSYSFSFGPFYRVQGTPERFQIWDLTSKSWHLSPIEIPGRPVLTSDIQFTQSGVHFINPKEKLETKSATDTGHVFVEWPHSRFGNSDGSRVYRLPLNDKDLVREAKRMAGRELSETEKAEYLLEK